MGQAGDKAFFASLDDDAVKFTVQYNPKEFQVNKALTWAESTTPGVAANPLQFQKGAPMTASFDLVFDTTGDSPVKNVQTAWVTGLLALTNASREAAQDEKSTLPTQRPHALIFTWGSFTMKCVVESINVTYLMFASTGEAVRARCQVKLKEWVPADPFVAGTGGATWGSGTIMLVGGGKNVSQIAQAAGIDARALAAANNIKDMSADLTGKEIVVRAK